MPWATAGGAHGATPGARAEGDALAEAARGVACAVHGSEKCVPRPGYVVVNLEIVPLHGCEAPCETCVPPENRTSSAHCATCPAGHQLVNTTCVPLPCADDPGDPCQTCVPVSQRQHVDHCAACNPGYVLEQNVCASANATCDGLLAPLPLQPLTQCLCGVGSSRAGSGAWNGTHWPPCEACNVGRYGVGSQCVDCAGGQYQEEPGSESCKPYNNTCDAGQGRTSAPAVSDVVCAPCVPGVNLTTQAGRMPCRPVHTCLPGQYESQAPTSSSDRHCASTTACDAATQVESQAPTSSTDRDCVPRCDDGFEHNEIFACVLVDCNNGSVSVTL